MIGLLHPEMFVVFEMGLIPFFLFLKNLHLTSYRVGFLAFLSQIPSQLAFNGNFNVEEHLTVEGLLFV